MFLEGHVSEISAIRFVPPKGELLLSADYFGSISAWDAMPDENGVGFERSRLLSEYSFSEFAVSDDGSLILAGGATSNDPDTPDIELKDAKLLYKGMLWKTDELIAYVSQYFTLKKGDVIFTGTPAGVGKVLENDVLTGTIEGKQAFQIRVK